VKSYDKAFRSGARMSTEETVAYGLEEREHAASVDAAAPADALSLTPRENEVADLIAAGLSNKAIAARLVIAQRTAEAHVEHILGKLGFSSRAQVAAWVTEQRAAESDDVSHV
jgi:DNA-binding NarL/FixJ family response regulator